MFLFQASEDLLGTLIDFDWYAGETGNMNAITFVGGAVDNFVEEDDLIVPFADGDVQVADAGKRFRQVGELVIVRGEKGAATEMVVQIFDHGPGERNARRRYWCRGRFRRG